MFPMMSGFASASVAGVQWVATMPGSTFGKPGQRSLTSTFPPLPKEHGEAEAANRNSNAPRKAGAGTLCFLAKAAGWKWTAEAMRWKEEWEQKNRAEETAADDIADRATRAIAKAVADLNAKYMMVSEAGKATIYAPAYDPVLNRSYYDRMAAADLRVALSQRSGGLSAMTTRGIPS